MTFDEATQRLDELRKELRALERRSSLTYDDLKSLVDRQNAVALAMFGRGSPETDSFVVELRSPDEVKNLLNKLTPRIVIQGEGGAPKIARPTLTPEQIYKKEISKILDALNSMQIEVNYRARKRTE